MRASRTLRPKYVSQPLCAITRDCIIHLRANVFANSRIELRDRRQIASSFAALSLSLEFSGNSGLKNLTVIQNQNRMTAILAQLLAEAASRLDDVATPLC